MIKSSGAGAGCRKVGTVPGVAEAKGISSLTSKHSEIKQSCAPPSQRDGRRRYRDRSR